MIKLESIDIGKIFVGNIKIKKIYIGNKVIFNNSGSGEQPV